MTDPVFTFTQTHEDDGTVTMTFRELTWTEVANHFHHFLSGCGFYVSRQELSDHFNEETYEQK